uniref:Uncharacterized protein n=1 Tax=Shiraia bambusicola TaxID=224420 RepID=A0A0D3QJ23_9PLEO|nr:hypothetical protein [Shiraia bambusicola]AJI44513.1 hypothetical protein [Shiraia bambusicola]
MFNLSTILNFLNLFEITLLLYITAFAAVIFFFYSRLFTNLIIFYSFIKNHVFTIIPLFFTFLDKTYKKLTILLYDKYCCIIIFTFNFFFNKNKITNIIIRNILFPSSYIICVITFNAPDTPVELIDMQNKLLAVESDIEYYSSQKQAIIEEKADLTERAQYINSVKESCRNEFGFVPKEIQEESDRCDKGFKENYEAMKDTNTNLLSEEKMRDSLIEKIKNRDYSNDTPGSSSGSSSSKRKLTDSESSTYISKSSKRKFSDN